MWVARRYSILTATFVAVAVVALAAISSSALGSGSSGWALSLDGREGGETYDVAESDGRVYVALSSIVGRIDSAETGRLVFDQTIEIDGTPRYLFALPDADALAILIETVDRDGPDFTWAWRIELRDPTNLSRLIGRTELDFSVVDAVSDGGQLFALGFYGDGELEAFLQVIPLIDREKAEIVEIPIPGLVSEYVGRLGMDGNRLYATVLNVDDPDRERVELLTLSLSEDRFLELIGGNVIGTEMLDLGPGVLDADDGRVLVTINEDYEDRVVILAMDDSADPLEIYRLPATGHAGSLRGDNAVIAVSGSALAFDASVPIDASRPVIGGVSCADDYFEPQLRAIEHTMYIACNELLAASMDLKSASVFMRDSQPAYRVAANGQAVCTTALSNTLACTDHESGRHTRHVGSLYAWGSGGPLIAIGEDRLASSTFGASPAMVQVWSMEDSEVDATGVVEDLPYIESLAASGDHVFVLVSASDGGHGVFAIDATDTAAPTLEGFAPLSRRVFNDPYGMVRRLAVSGDVGLARTGEGVRIIDVSEPSAPRSAGSVKFEEPVQDLAVADDYGFVLTAPSDDSEPSLLVLDVTDVDKPRMVDTQLLNNPRAVAAADGLVLVGDGRIVRLFEISVDGKITQVAERSVGSWARQLASGGGRFHGVSNHHGLMTLRPHRQG